MSILIFDEIIISFKQDIIAIENQARSIRHDTSHVPRGFSDGSPKDNSTLYAIVSLQCDKK